MNKKFTMMLAAFLAAGYTITAEAGVVKVTNPSAGKTYVIANGNSTYALQAPAEGTALKSVDISDGILTSKDLLWTVSGNQTGKIESVKYADYGVKLVEDAYVFGTPATDITYINESGIANSNGKSLIIGESVETKDSYEAISYYEITEDVTASNVVLGSADSYLVVVKDGSNYTIEKKSQSEILAKGLLDAAAWTIKNGVAESKAYSGVYLKTLNLSGTSTVTKSESEALNISVKEGNEWYFGADGTNVINSSSHTTVKELSELSDPSNTPSFTDVEQVKTLAGLVEVRLQVCVSGQTTNFVKQASNENATLSTYTGEDKTPYYWSYNKDTKEFKNANGDVLNLGGATKFDIVWSEGGYFQLVVTQGDETKFVKFDSRTGFSLDNATTATFFAASTAVDDEIDAAEFNKLTQGVFSLTYQIDDVVAEGNPFEGVTAINVNAAGDYGTGTYLVVNAPSDVKVEEDYTSADVDDLDDLTFVVVDPANRYDIFNLQQGLGLGAKFTTVKGKNLVNSDEKAGKCHYDNAKFTIYKSDANDSKLSLKVSPYVNDEDGEALETTGELIVAAAKSGSKVVVTTIKTDAVGTAVYNKYATLGSANIVDVEDFLTKDAQIFNIQFVSTTEYKGADNKTENYKRTHSEYGKYLGLGTEGGNANVLAQGVDLVDLNIPQNQWIVSEVDEDNNIITFTNREDNSQSFSAQLVKTDEENVYRLAQPSDFDFDFKYYEQNAYTYVCEEAVGLTGGKLIKLSKATVDPMAGYVSDEFDNAGLINMYFNINTSVNPTQLNVRVTNANNKPAAVSLHKSSVAQWEAIKFVEDTVYQYNDYAYLKNNAPEVEDEGDKLAVVTYAFKYYYPNDPSTAYYLNADMNSVSAYEDAEDADKFVVKINNDGSYSLIPVSSNDDILSKVLDNGTYKANSISGYIDRSGDIYNSGATFYIEAETPTDSYNHVPQHVMFKNANRNTYMAVNEDGAGIMDAVSALKAEYTKEDLTFWLDTADNKAVVPSFYISKAGKYMFNSIDSLYSYDEGQASDFWNSKYLLPGSEKDARAIFRAGDLKESNKLETLIDGKKKELTEAKDLNYYKFKIVLKDAAVDDEYVVRSMAAGNYYLTDLNGNLGFTTAKNQAIVFNIERTEAPTSNEGVVASEVKVVAQNGSVVVKNAAGKNVVVSTILGQVVANEVLTSDNATINVPAGIVVVAVEGESFKVNVK